jgi:succinate-semialdehyde dehydrogenase/glutarate-semialdehyde dehydrogenase
VRHSNLKSLTCSTHGPLIHAKAVQKVADHVNDAVKKGAKVLIGGQAGEGNFYEPTVLIDMPVSADVSKDETFGPLAPCYMFETEEEVVRLANDTEFGLAGYFYSRDSKLFLARQALMAVGRIWRVAEALQCGMIGVNTGIMSQASIPFGGIKES